MSGLTFAERRAFAKEIIKGNPIQSKTTLQSENTAKQNYFTAESFEEHYNKELWFFQTRDQELPTLVTFANAKGIAKRDPSGPVARTLVKMGVITKEKLQGLNRGMHRNPVSKFPPPRLKEQPVRESERTERFRLHV